MSKLFRTVVSSVFLLSLLTTGINAATYHYYGSYNSINYSDSYSSGYYYIKSYASVRYGNPISGASTANRNGGEWVFYNLGVGDSYGVNLQIGTSYYSTHDHCVVTYANGSYTFTSIQ